MGMLRAAGAGGGGSRDGSCSDSDSLMRKDNIVRVASKDTDSSDSFDLDEFAAKYARDKSPGGVTSRKRSKGSGGQRGNKASGMSLSSEEEALFVAISFGKVHRIERFLKT